MRVRYACAPPCRHNADSRGLLTEEEIRTLTTRRARIGGRETMAAFAWNIRNLHSYSVPLGRLETGTLCGTLCGSSVAFSVRK